MALSPTSSRPSGGYSAAEGGVYFLTANAVVANNTTRYSWSFGYGTPQLSLTNPLVPVVLAAGVYALAVTGIAPATFTTGTKTVTDSHIDVENNDAAITVEGVIEMFAANPMPRPGSITFYCPVGGTLKAQITHNDTTLGTLDFLDKAYVQRVA